MAKPLYFVSPNDGKLYRYDGVIWSALVNTALPNFLNGGGSAGGTGQTGGSQAVPFVWRGRLWVAYYTATEGVRYRFIEVINLGSTPTYDTANIVSVDPSDFGLIDKAKTVFSNVEYYRGMVVRLAWPEDSNAMFSVVFDDFNNDGDPEAKIFNVEGVPSSWTSWEIGSTTADADPHGGGHLFAHDQTLFWSPRGAFDRVPTKVWERLFKIDIRESSAGMSIIPGVISTGQARYPEWDSDTATPASLSGAITLGMSRCSLAAGSVNGKLFSVNANGTVDVIDDLTFVRTRAFDLRDAAEHVVASSLAPSTPTSGAPAQVRFATGATVSPGATTDQVMLNGGRLDIVSGPRSGQKFDIVAMFRDGASPAATSPVEFKLVDTVTGTATAALTPSDLCDVRRGFLGSAFDIESSLRGSPGIVQCVTKGGYTYIISGARKDNVGGAQPAAPLIVTRWDGNVPAAVTRLVISGSVSVSGIDATIDEDADVLHILYHDFETGLVRHAVIDLAAFTLANHLSVFALTNNTNFSCGINPGGLFAFSTYEPSAEIQGSPVFNPALKIVTIQYKLWTQMPGGLSNVSFKVEYNRGNGWQIATAHTSSGPTANLSASAAGISHAFVHDLNADLPAFIGPIQYRLTTFIP